MIKDLGEAVNVLNGIQGLCLDLCSTIFYLFVAVEVEKWLKKFKKIEEQFEEKKEYPPGYFVPDEKTVISQWEKLGNAGKL